MDSEKRCDKCGASSVDEKINNAVTVGTTVVHSKTKKAAGNAAVMTVSVILAAVLFVFAIIAGAVGAVGRQLADEAIDSAVSGLEMFDYINETVKIRYTDGTELRFAEMIYKTVDPIGKMPDKFESDLADVLNSYSNETALTVRAFVSKKIRGVVRDIKDQTANTKITAEEIGRLVELLKAEMSDDIGEVTDGETDNVVAEINKYSIGGFTVDSLKQGNETLFELLSIVTSDMAFYVMIAICIVLIGFILAVNVSRLGRGITVCGVSMLAAGIVSAVGGALLEWQIVNGEIIDSTILRDLLDAFSDNAVEFMLVFGIVVAAIALITSAVGVTATVAANKRQRAKCACDGGDRR